MTSDSPVSIYRTELKSLPLLHRGKVRDIYAVDEAHLLIVATDRLSAFDVVLPDPIPGKGAVLTAISNFWFGYTERVVPNHRVARPIAEVVSDPEEAHEVADHATLVKRLEPLPVEAIVRGYLAGSGWKDYQRTGRVCGIELPHGLQQAEKLPEPLFTPSTKAEAGAHDENIDFERTVELIGAELAEAVRETSLRLYHEADAYAAERGIIIADTKFEFGLDAEGRLHLIDEALTPDSSRFWPVDQYALGSSPPSFDKQFVRDYLERLDWNKQPPAPHLPDDVIKKTAAKYREAKRRLVE